MASDVPQLRYLLPKFKGNYTATMKTLESSCNFDTSDVAKFRLKVIEFGRIHGWPAASDAFNVSRSTYFLWKKELKQSQGKLSGLIPRSTRPHRVRRMDYDPRLAIFIRQVREQYGRIGKQKLVLLVEAYAQEIHVHPIKATAIGKIIKRHRYFFEGKRHYHKSRQGILRVKKAPKEKIPGYIEMDSVIVRTQGELHVFITALDVATKYAACVYAKTAKSRKALELLRQVQSNLDFPLRTIQTDNGSEFLGEFEDYCQTHHIPHVFTYPRSPRINGGIERFNRTIQEEFINRTDSLLLGPKEITTALNRYLSWYNDTRPHQSLGYQSPSNYQQSLQSKM